MRPIESFSNTSIIRIERTNNCSDNFFCTSTLAIQLTIDDSDILNVTSLTCEAINFTVPYDIDVKTEALLNITRKRKLCLVM